MRIMVALGGTVTPNIFSIVAAQALLLIGAEQ
jgi:hypothetical protein